MGQVLGKMLVSVASAGVEQETFEGVHARGLRARGLHAHVKLSLNNLKG